MRINELPIGTRVLDPNTTYLGAPIVWKIAEHKRKGYPKNSTTLITEKILTAHSFDGSNGQGDRGSNGDNRWSVSNIRQWLNSAGEAEKWFQPKYETDTPPADKNCYWSAYGYDDEAGFLINFSTGFLRHILPTPISTILANVDGGGTVETIETIFLANKDEIGLGDGIPFPIFTDNNSRTAKYTPEGVAYYNKEITDHKLSLVSPINEYAPQYWYLRDPRITDNYSVAMVNSWGGITTYAQAPQAYGIRPMCNIKNTAFVSDTPMEGGIYELLLELPKPKPLQPIAAEKLYYVNSNDELVEFSANSIYHVNVAKMAGLSDVKNTLYTTASMGQDGVTVTGNKIQPRTIAISGAIKSVNKDEIIEHRRRLNKILNPSLPAHLIYEYLGQRRIIDCRLETAPIFSRGNALLTFDIDVVCPYPFWRDETEIKTSIAGWVGGFEFNIASGGLEIPSPNGLEMGIKSPNTVVTVNNYGDVKTGIRVEFTALGTVINPKLTNVATTEYMAFRLTMQEGDKLIVTTGYNEKACILRCGEIEMNALGYWDTAGTFLQLETGENYFAFTADSNADRLDVAIFATNNYSGV